MTEDKKGGELVARDELVPLDRLKALVGERPLPLASGPDEAAFEIAQRIMQAETVEDVLNRAAPVHARELLGRPLQFRGMHLQESDYEGGLGAYAVAECVDIETGEMLLVTCGGYNVLTQLVKIWLLDGFPITARFGTTDKPTRRGYRPLWLEPVR